MYKSPSLSVMYILMPAAQDLLYVTGYQRAMLAMTFLEESEI